MPSITAIGPGRYKNAKCMKVHMHEHVDVYMYVCMYVCMRI